MNATGYVVLEKLDGNFVSPYYTQGGLCLELLASSVYILLLLSIVKLDVACNQVFYYLAQKLATRILKLEESTVLQ